MYERKKQFLYYMKHRGPFFPHTNLNNASVQYFCKNRHYTFQFIYFRLFFSQKKAKNENALVVNKKTMMRFFCIPLSRNRWSRNNVSCIPLNSLEILFGTINFCFNELCTNFIPIQKIRVSLDSTNADDSSESSGVVVHGI